MTSNTIVALLGSLALACSSTPQGARSITREPEPPSPAAPEASPAGGEASPSYAVVPTTLIDVGDRKIAMRSVGSGTPFILVNRFRGTLDTWDPAFIDALAQHYRVITFDYSGLGASTGQPPTAITSMASDAYDLARALKIDKTILGGWSIGGLAAQTAAAQHPDFVSHLVLIGTAPPGKNAHPIEKIFLERAHKEINDLDDETVLFFEPRAERSRNAAKLSHDRIAKRTTHLSAPVPPSAWNGLHQAAAEFFADKLGIRDQLKHTALPILVLSGDHDIVFPIENWYDLTRELPTTQLVTFPLAGHGPQHEYVDECVGYIATFVRSAS